MTSVADKSRYYSRASEQGTLWGQYKFSWFVHCRSVPIMLFFCLLFYCAILKILPHYSFRNTYYFLNYSQATYATALINVHYNASTIGGSTVPLRQGLKKTDFSTYTGHYLLK